MIQDMQIPVVPIIYGEQFLKREEARVLGAKNLLPMDVAYIKSINTSGTWSGNAYTLNGVTFTINTDGTITANGTASANALFTLRTAQTFPAGDFIKSGCPANGSNTSYGFGGNTGDDWGSGKNFTSDGVTHLSFIVYVVSGYTANNLLFKPMVRLASDPDNTYVPYAMTNRELTDRVKSMWEGTIGTPEPIGTITINGTTYTKYRKIINMGVLSGTSKTALHNVPYAHTLSLSGVAIRTTSGNELVLSLPHIDISSNDKSKDMALIMTNTNVAIQYNNDHSAFNGIVTIEYYN